MWVGGRFEKEVEGVVSSVSVEQHYMDAYNLRLRFPKAELVVVKKGKREVLLPAEVCRIVMGQKYGKTLNESQVRALLEIACVDPASKERTIEKVRHPLSLHPHHPLPFTFLSLLSSSLCVRRWVWTRTRL